MRRLFAPILMLAISCSAGAQTYTIETLADGGLPQNVLRTSTTLGRVNAVAVDEAGNVFLQFGDYSVVLRLDAASGGLTLAAGNGMPGFGGDNGAATRAPLGPALGGIAVDSSGNLYIADTRNHRIRVVSNRVIATAAGTGTPGYSGDNGPAASAQLNAPQGVAVDAFGNLYIADAGNHSIREVSNGVITTVAGIGTAGNSGDNGPAASAQLNAPQGIAVDSAGNLYIADSGNHSIRKVSGGVVTTVAGTGTPGFSGDGGPAASADLNAPQGVALDTSGNLYIADSGNHRVRKLTAGVILTIAGNGTETFSGDGGPAASAGLDGPAAIAVSSSGNVYVADSRDARVRILVPSGSPCTSAADQLAQTSGNLPTSGCAGAVPSLYGMAPGNVVGSSSANVALAAAPASVAARSAKPRSSESPRGLNPGGVVNGASFAPGQAVAPGSIASAFGTYAVSSNAGATSLPLSGSLGGLSLQFANGEQAPLFYVSSTQVNFQVPWDQSTTTLAAIVNGQTSTAQTVNILPYAPGIFTVFNTNNQGSPEGVALDSSYRAVNSSNPAIAGEYILIYCTGLGAVNDPPPAGSPALSNPVSQTTTPATVTIGGVGVTPSFAGLAPGYVGLYQVNVQVPADAATGSEVTLSISIGGETSNTVTIPINAVPAVYQTQYAQLNQEISDFTARVATACSGCSYPVLYVGELSGANANVGYPILSNLPALEAEVDGLHALGFNGISVQAGFPTLYAPFYAVTSASLGQTGLNCPGDSDTGGTTAAEKQASWASVYGSLASYARTKYGMKVVVAEEVMDNSSQSSGPNSYAACVTHWYQTFVTTPSSTGLTAFATARAAQSVAVAQAMQPDYLIVSEEPGTESGTTGLPLSEPANAASMLSTIFNSVLPLKTTSNVGMQVGAGFGNFENNYAALLSTYTNNACESACVSPAMDFLDMHLFLVNESAPAKATPSQPNGPNYQTNALAILNNAAGMPVTISQAWCHKTDDAEWGVLNSVVAEAREIYSFWGPVTDRNFFQLLISFANHGHVRFAVPFDTSQLYAYVPWSPATAIEGEGGTLPAQQAKYQEGPATTAAMAAGQLSPVGYAVRQFLLGY